MSWQEYFDAVRKRDFLAAFDAMVGIGLKPLALKRDDHGKIKSPVGFDWGKKSVADRRKLLAQLLVRRPTDVGIGCQPFGYVVFDLDPPDHDTNRLGEVTDDFIDIVFGGELHDTFVVKGVGLHIWYKADDAFLQAYGEQARRIIPMPCGGHIDVYTGSAKGQTQVACAPSEGKVIQQQREPAQLPEVAQRWMLENLQEFKASANPSPRREDAAPGDAWETGWFNNRIGKLLANIEAAGPGYLHHTLRSTVRTIAGYAAGMGQLYRSSDIQDAVIESLHRNGNCRSFRCAEKTIGWAWDRGSSSPMVPDAYDRKKGVTVAVASAVARNVAPPPVSIVPYHDPFLVASEFVASEGESRFVTWQGTTWQWKRGRYQEVKPEEIRSRAAGFADHWFMMHAEQEFAMIDDPEKRANYKKRPVTASVSQSVYQAFASITVAGESILSSMPGWLDRTATDWPPCETLALKNCMLNVRTKETRDLTNRWFSRTRSNVEWEGTSAQCPNWIAFLSDVFAHDMTSALILRMWFGLCLTTDTSFQKILTMVGPPRSGKGTIVRIQQSLMGESSVVSLSLGDLAREFGLEKLIGSPVAVMPDVRFGSRENISDAIERLLSISGEDEIRIARKYQSDWSGQLPTRLIMASNEMPRLPDSAAALPTRLIVLQFAESFVGREDATLHKRLIAELPGILAWAVEGYRMLLAAGKFPENDATADAVEEAREIGSPTLAFLNECVDVTLSDDDVIDLPMLYESYTEWCRRNGHKGASQGIMRKQILDLNPRLRVRRPGTRGAKRSMKLAGVSLKTTAPRASRW